MTDENINIPQIANLEGELISLVVKQSADELQAVSTSAADDLLALGPHSIYDDELLQRACAGANNQRQRLQLMNVGTQLMRETDQLK
jgi:hypothetical protein